MRRIEATAINSRIDRRLGSVRVNVVHVDFQLGKRIEITSIGVSPVFERPAIEARESRILTPAQIIEIEDQSLTSVSTKPIEITEHLGRKNPKSIVEIPIIEEVEKQNTYKPANKVEDVTKVWKKRIRVSRGGRCKRMGEHEHGKCGSSYCRKPVASAKTKTPTPISFQQSKSSTSERRKSVARKVA